MNDDYRRLRRSAKDKVMCGVCAGIGEYFKLDPILIRVLFVLFGLQFWGIVVYFIMAAIIPEE